MSTELGSGDTLVRVRDERNKLVMLEGRIAQLKRDLRYAHTFPADSPKVAKGDMLKLSENFDQIAAGTVRVE